MNRDISRRPVYVGRGSTVYHGRMDCDELQESAFDGITWCEARAAHQSSLTPCPACATLFMARLSAQFGTVPSRERHRRELPRLSARAPQ